MWLLIETSLVVIAVTIAFRFPALGSRWFGRVERACGEFARRRRLAVVIAAVLPVVARLILLPLMPVPTPGGEDEFSYLLAADTFAHGRITNPPHPMWMHLESLHILQQPTYASMYFPAQGLFLAVGQVIFGTPWAGVLISTGVMCGAICWMLQGWLPARWALLGGLIAVMRLGVFSYWANNYSGGAPAAIGGALVLGAFPRIKRRQRVRDALLMAIGLVILANSRPYEGLVFSLPLGAAMLAWLLGKHGPSLKVSVRDVVLPVVLVLTLAAAAMGYYNWRVTGNPFLMPEQLSLDIYHSDRAFLWQSPGPQLDYHHKELRDFDVYWLQKFRQARSIGGAVFSLWAKMVWIWFFFLGPALTFPILACVAIVPYGFPWSRVSPRIRLWLRICGVLMIGLLLEFYFEPHYVSFIAGLVLVLVLTTMRYLRHWEWRGRPTGVFMVRAVPMICLVMALLRVGAMPLHILNAAPQPQTWCYTLRGNTERARILGELMRSPGRHLVIVRYGPTYDINTKWEWVYNEADIDNTKVVWAREMGEHRDRELISYFKDRHVWLVEPDKAPPRLSAYAFPAGR